MIRPLTAIHQNDADSLLRAALVCLTNFELALYGDRDGNDPNLTEVREILEELRSRAQRECGAV